MLRTLIALGSVVLLGAGLTPQACAQKAGWPLIYARENGQWFRMRADGSERQPLAQVSGNARDFVRTTEDGLLFRRLGKGRSEELCLLDSGAAEPRVLAASDARISFSVSPDGGRVAFSSKKSGRYSARIVGAKAGIKGELLCEGARRDPSPSFQSDGAVLYRSADGKAMRKALGQPAIAVKLPPIWERLPFDPHGRQHHPESAEVVYSQVGHTYVTKLTGRGGKPLGGKRIAMGSGLAGARNASWDPQGAHRIFFTARAMPEGENRLCVAMPEGEGWKVSTVYRSKAGDFRYAWVARRWLKGKGPQKRPSLGEPKPLFPPQKPAEAKPTEKPAPLPKGDSPIPGPDQVAETAPESFRVRFETTKGDFVIRCRREWSPHGADRFYSLVKVGYFDDVCFFRAVRNFVVQFGIHGDPRVNRLWFLNPAASNFPDDKLAPGKAKSNGPGTLSFAKSNAPNSRSVQLFLNLGDNKRLDPMGFTPFGEVEGDGLSVVKKLYTGYGDQTTRLQQQIGQQGNAFLRQRYPKLDYIKRATILAK